MECEALQRCTPEQAGVESRQVMACIRALMHDKTTMNGFMAARFGKVFAECWWAPFGPGLVHSNHSLGKSYTSTAIGIAVDEGYLSLNERMVDLFAPEIAARHITLSARMQRITVEHVLTMTNGMARHPDMSGDWLGNYFRTPMADEPGTHFMYNSAGSCMLGAIIQKRTGQNLKEYLTPRLFEKIGIDPNRFVWLKFPNGIDAEPGTFATTEDNLRLAMLYANGGRWDGQQIVSEAFVKASLSVQVQNPTAPEQKDGRCGYGYQLWACSIPGVYRFDGGQGQYGIIWPQKSLVVAVHEGAMCPDGPQKTLDALYDNLLLCLQDLPLPEHPAEYTQLQQLEAALRLPQDTANTLPLQPGFSGSYRVTQGQADPWLAVAPPGAGDLFAAFRDPSRKADMQVFALSVTKEACVFAVNDAVFEAAWDGTLRHNWANTVFVPLGSYAATARFCGADTLQFTLHWLNGWFVTELFFKRTQGGLQLTVKKLRLNETDNYLNLQAEAVRTGPFAQIKCGGCAQ